MALPVNVSFFVVDACYNLTIYVVFVAFAPESELAVDALAGEMLHCVNFRSETVFVNAVAKANVVSAESCAVFNDACVYPRLSLIAKILKII